MSKHSNKPARLLPRLLLVSTGVAVVLAALGYFPTMRLAGSEALASMAAGIGIGLIVSCIGALPVSLAAGGDPTRMPTVVLASTALRFVLVLALTASAALSGWFDRAVLVTWVALSYMALLAVDTLFAVRMVGGGRRPRA